jgi:hypothetical protein
MMRALDRAWANPNHPISQRFRAEQQPDASASASACVRPHQLGNGETAMKKNAGNTKTVPVEPEAEAEAPPLNGIVNEAENASADVPVASTASEPDDELPDRVEDLPDVAKPASGQTGSQEADPLDALLESAVAPQDEDVVLSEADLGPPQYTSLPRRTSPPQMVPFRIFPKSCGSETIYMLALNRDAQKDGDQDTYALSKDVRMAFSVNPITAKKVHRFDIRMGVTSLGKPFFLEVNLDDQGVYGRTRRDLVDVAEKHWVYCTSDRSEGYTPHPTTVEGAPDPVTKAPRNLDPMLLVPEQSFKELFKLTYKIDLIASKAHPLFQRLTVRRKKL